MPLRTRDGDIYAALRDCHIALSLDPNHAKALFRQARCLYELRWCQEALSCMNHFKERFPDQAQGNAAKMLERDIRAAAFAETEGRPEQILYTCFFYSVWTQCGDFLPRSNGSRWGCDFRTDERLASVSYLTVLSPFTPKFKEYILPTVQREMYE